MLPRGGTLEEIGHHGIVIGGPHAPGARPQRPRGGGAERRPDEDVVDGGNQMEATGEMERRPVAPQYRESRVPNDG